MLFLASLLLLNSAQAEPVLVPALTAETGADASRVAEFYEVLVGELGRSGFEVVNAAALAEKGLSVENCATSPTCVPTLFSSWSAPIAVVGAVRIVGDRERITLRFYVPRERSPAKVFQVDIRDGEAWTNAERVSVLIDALLTLVDSEYAAPEPVTGQAVMVLEDEGEPSAAPAPAAPAEEPPPAPPEEQTDEVQAFLDAEDAGEAPAEPAPPRTAAPTTKPMTPEEQAEADAAERDEMGLDNLTYRIYRKSGVEQRRWVQTRKPRDGRGAIEVSGGLASGDVHRQYDVRIAMRQDGFKEIGRYESDIVRADYAKHINFAFGYNMGQWWEFSFQAGLQATKKSLSSGWEMYDSDNQVIKCPEPDMCTSDHGGPVTAYQGIVSPRVRFFALPLGPVKLYTSGGLKLVIMDGFHVTDLNVVDYPDKPGRTLFGWFGGGGVMVDPQDYLGLFAEVEYIGWLVNTDRQVVSSGQAPRFIPGRPDQVGFLLRPTVGLQYRF